MTKRVPDCGYTRSRRFCTFLSVGPLIGNRALIVPGQRISCFFSLASRRVTSVRIFTGRITRTVGRSFPYVGIKRTILKLRMPRTRVRLVPVRDRGSVLFDGPGLALSTRRFGAVTRTVGRGCRGVGTWACCRREEGPGDRVGLLNFLLLESRGCGG